MNWGQGDGTVQVHNSEKEKVNNWKFQLHTRVLFFLQNYVIEWD